MKIPAVVLFFASIEVVIGSDCAGSVHTASSSPVRTTKGCCIFPFTKKSYYRTRKYTGCADLGSGKPQCKTSNYPEEYGDCPSVGYFGPSTTIAKGSCESKLNTFSGNAGGKCCVFPFTFEGKEYTECTDVGKPYRWCATTANYDVDKEFGRCPDEEYCPSHVYATGPGKGACCVFPFTDGDKVHHSCAEPEKGSDKTKKWCATTTNYNRDKMWGYCSNQDTCSSGIYTAYGNSDYACCHFPFEYEGKNYSKCIDDSYGSTWCATTPKYDYNNGIGKYGDCPKKETCTKDKRTYGGNANKDCCVFPFTYNGKLYRRCTDDDSQIGTWCATTDNFDRDRKYGFCEGGCVFPFVYKGQSYDSCTRKDFGRLWCGTTDNVDRDNEFSYCEGIDYCSDKMPKAIDPNTDQYSCCVFPFTYKGKTYTDCTTVDFGRKWCSLTSNYDRDGLHGYCESNDYCSAANPKAIAPNTNELSCCHFPFTYNGKTYDGCTADDYGRKWCSLTSNPDRDNLYGYCESDDYCSDANPKAIAPNTNELSCCFFPFIYKGKTYTNCTSIDYGRKWCSLTSNFDKDKLYGFCETADYCTDENPKAIATNSNDLSCCYFPFIYKGKTYDSCTTVDYGRRWCALTSNVDRDNEYGFCESADYCSAKRPQAFSVNSAELPCCHFPFEYGGKEYNKCTNADSDGAWCATTSNYERDEISGYCGAPESVDSKCKFQLGKGDGFPLWEGAWPWKECISRCRRRRLTESRSINGVRVYSTEEKNMCFCLRNMVTSGSRISNFISCLLEDTVADYEYQLERDMYDETDWF